MGSLQRLKVTLVVGSLQRSKVTLPPIAKVKGHTAPISIPQPVVVAGVGPAKAINLIREHRSIEEIIKQGKVSRLKPSVDVLGHVYHP